MQTTEQTEPVTSMIVERWHLEAMIEKRKPFYINQHDWMNLNERGFCISSEKRVDAHVSASWKVTPKKVNQ